MDDSRYPEIKTISLKQARAIAKKAGKDVSTPTIIKWIDEHIPKLGHQPAGNGGRWFVFEEAFTKFIYGEGYTHGADNNNQGNRGAGRRTKFKKG